MLLHIGFSGCQCLSGCRIQSEQQGNYDAVTAYKPCCISAWTHCCDAAEGQERTQADIHGPSIIKFAGKLARLTHRTAGGMQQTLLDMCV